jgi:hypothetical protein
VAVWKEKQKHNEKEAAERNEAAREARIRDLEEERLRAEVRLRHAEEKRILSGTGAPNEPPPGARVSKSPAPAERERIVERQIVVMHCIYCGKLTPVDLSQCRECGARL